MIEARSSSETWVSITKLHGNTSQKTALFQLNLDFCPSNIETSGEHTMWKLLWIVLEMPHNRSGSATTVQENNIGSEWEGPQPPVQ
jgi:hypothetical protein